MRIQHNIAALNSYRQLSSNNTSVSKNLEKLSSGYRINRAGDDAAGLAISEKMRAQIKGLETAQKNANDGISLVQTAEGALTEVHSMLNRMVELATQSANGTYDDSTDRANLQKELDSLMSEIDRISDGTDFNGINLLDGSLGGAKVSSTNGAAAEGGAAATKASFAVELDDLLTSGVASDKDFKIGNVTVASGKATKSSFKVDIGSIVGDTGIADGKDFKVGNKTITGATATTATKATALAAIRTAVDTQEVTINGKDYVAAMAANSTEITFTLKTAGEDNLDTTAVGNIAAAIKNDSTAITSDKVAVVQNGKNAGAVTKDNTLKALDALIQADQEFTIDSKKYKAALDGTKLTFTAVDAGANTLNQTNILNAITNDTNKPADAKFTKINDGEALKAPDKAATNAQTAIEFSNMPKAGDTIKIGNTTYEFVKSGEAAKGTGNTAVTLKDTTAATASAFKDALAGNTAIKEAAVDGSKVTFKTADAAKDITQPVEIKQTAQGLTLQIGDTAKDFNKLNVSVSSMNCQSLGIKGIDIGTQSGAQLAIDKIKAAINTVSSTRGDLGAIQNRLEHTINNLSVTTENMTAAESRVRDVDMAQEMMNFTKNNILVQASQAMLAQANQLPQGVLQLLQ